MWRTLPGVPSQVSTFDGASTPRSSRNSSVPFSKAERYSGRHNSTDKALIPVKLFDLGEQRNIIKHIKFHGDSSSNAFLAAPRKPVKCEKSTIHVS